MFSHSVFFYGLLTLKHIYTKGKSQWKPFRDSKKLCRTRSSSPYTAWNDGTSLPDRSHKHGHVSAMSKPNKPEHKARSGWFGSLLADASDLANRPPKRPHSMQYVGWVNVSGVGPIWATTVLISWLTARSMNRDQDISSPMLIAIPLISLLRIHHQKTATITNLSNQNSPSQNSQDGIVQRKELLSLKNGYHFLCVHPRTHKHKNTHARSKNMSTGLQTL